jgi:hypothetical protein
MIDDDDDDNNNMSSSRTYKGIMNSSSSGAKPPKMIVGKFYTFLRQEFHAAGTSVSKLLTEHC